MMPPIPKTSGRPVRSCKFCGGSYEDRGPGSGIKRSMCSDKCARLAAAKKAGGKPGRNFNRTLENAAAAKARAIANGELPTWGFRSRNHGAAGHWPGKVFVLYGADCLSCGRPAVQAHHIVAKQAIKKAMHLSPASRNALLFDPTNGFPICRRCHEKHELAVERLYFSMLPSQAVEWAVANGFASRVFDDRIYLGAPEGPA